MQSSYPIYWAGAESRRSTSPHRKPTEGPEEVMVRDFVSRLQVKTARGCRVALFKEPWLQSGAPDLVAVLWRPSRMSSWSPARAEINASDLRLLHWLTSVSSAELCRIRELFGKPSEESLRRLEQADMINLTTRRVKARPLAALFAIERIYAIEAKVSHLPKGLEQAALNLWFAQESYILVPQVPRGSVFFDTALDLGVGVWCAADATLDARASSATDGKPLSYASWLFNEWLWRAEVRLPK